MHSAFSVPTTVHINMLDRKLCCYVVFFVVRICSVCFYFFILALVHFICHPVAALLAAICKCCRKPVPCVYRMSCRTSPAPSRPHRCLPLLLTWRGMMGTVRAQRCRLHQGLDPYQSVGSNNMKLLFIISHLLF